MATATMAPGGGLKQVVACQNGWVVEKAGGGLKGLWMVKTGGG